jgi:DNA-binding transcriptional LysR family regulator
LRELEDARRVTGADGETRGRLVVSAPITLGAHCVVPRLPALRRAHPALSIDLRLEDRVVDLVGDGVDVAIRAGVPLPDSTAFVGHPLLEFRRWVVASPSYLRRHGSIRDPDQLPNHECLTQNVPTGPSSRWRFVRDGEEQVVEVRRAVCTNAPLALLDLAREGLGLAFLPEWLVKGDVESGRLRRVLASWDTPLVKTFALHRTELRGSPRIAALLRVFRPS